MPTEVSNSIQVDKRIAALGCSFPRGITTLPENFETAASPLEFRQRSEAATIRALFKNNNVPIGELLPPDERPPYLQNNDFSWIAPTLFVPLLVLSENPLAVSVGLNVIGNYLTDFFRGVPGKKTVKLNIIVETKRDRSCKKINYEGDVQGLSALAEIVRQTSDG